VRVVFKVKSGVRRCGKRQTRSGSSYEASEGISERFGQKANTKVSEGYHPKLEVQLKTLGFW